VRLEQLTQAEGFLRGIAAAPGIREGGLAECEHAQPKRPSRADGESPAREFAFRPADTIEDGEDLDRRATKDNGPASCDAGPLGGITWGG
jgi:hypothetical protein